MLSDIKGDIELLDAQYHKNIAVIPIKTPQNYSVDLLTLKKGYKLGLVKVAECSESVVNTLIVKNKSTTPLILIDGEEIIGGDQNRIVNESIVIDAHDGMKIPVNCTEKGRWGFKKDFEPSNHIANYRTRLAKASAIKNNQDVQHNVWASIDELENARENYSQTQAMAESYENANYDLAKIISDFKIIDGQTGIMIFVDGAIKGFEMFLNSEIYADYHEKILKSYLIDININDDDFNIDDADKIALDILESEYIKKESVGLEDKYELKRDDGVGTFYIFRDELIHISYLKV